MNQTADITKTAYLVLADCTKRMLSKGEIGLFQEILKCCTYVVPKMKKGRYSVEYQPFMSVSVARRGIEPLISRMKTWRPNRLDERAIVVLGVQNYEMYCILQNIL